MESLENTKGAKGVGSWQRQRSITRRKTEAWDWKFDSAKRASSQKNEPNENERFYGTTANYLDVIYYLNISIFLLTLSLVFFISTEYGNI